MRRLLFNLVTFVHGTGSGSQYLLGLLDYYYKHRTDILYTEIILCCQKSEAPFFSSLYGDKFMVQSINTKGRMRFVREVFLPIEMKIKPGDLLVNIDNYYSCVFNRGMLMLTIHDMLFKHKEWIHRPLFRLQRSLFLRRGVKKATKIVTISEFSKSEIVKYYPYSINKIEIIRNYPNLSKYPEKTPHEKKNYFLAVCSAAQHKNTISIIKAFERYCQKGGDMNFVLVGSLNKNKEVYAFYCGLPESIKERISEYYNIPNEVLSDLYQSANCYISASLYEGQGMPLVEAMYYNLPMLLSDRRVFHEVSAETAVFFDPLDINDIALKMLEFEDHYVDYSAILRELFSPEATSGRYVFLINQLFDNK